MRVIVIFASRAYLCIFNVAARDKGACERRENRRRGVGRRVTRHLISIIVSQYSCPDDVTVIARNSDDKKLLLSELMTCGVIIYDISQEPNQIEEACWVLKGSLIQIPEVAPCATRGHGDVIRQQSPAGKLTIMWWWYFYRYKGQRLGFLEIVRALERAEEKSPKVSKRQQPKRYFMLISTIMTWALTKPLDPADPNLPFTEADYRKRKPHPNYKEHLRCEREVVTVKKRANLKSNLKTLVVCCGVTYGEKQGPLHHLFKMAWQTAPFLPIFGKGSNKVPLLHVRDLAATVLAMLQNWPARRYIVAVERELISQNTIVKSEQEIARRLGTGKVKSVTKQEALLLPEVSQRAYDMMTVDLNIDSVYIIDRIRWRFDMPFRDVVDDVVREYKAARNLRPVKIIVLGPPASGKTRLARFLADHYGINYVHVKTLISDTIQRLRDDLEDTAEDADNDKENEEEAEEEEEEEVEEQDEKEIVASRVELQEQLDEIRTNLAANNDRLDDVVLNKLFLKRLKSKDCLNQGYVIDGHPKTLEQARMLFLINEEDPRGEHVEKLEDESEDEDAAEEAKNVDVTILPELVVVLEASDHFLKERVMNRPESEIQGTHYTEECMLRRMKEYRERNTDDNTPLQLFDEMEIYTLVIPVEADVCPDMFPTFYQCAEILGEPRNYGPQ
ncbi:adenylate kinase 7-like [Harpegnathos saltator]|uniref:adenylate kinase 7-like n=1 Tax=Harpegnathos saltator TaxID=610380 RepID=UPI000DBEF232|nr:adenylate kinase 7-like [Harpegnathos saltator]